jgi:hypothetical protein
MSDLLDAIKERCMWRMDRGYWKGDTCGNLAVDYFDWHGKAVPLCAVHSGIAHADSNLCWSSDSVVDQYSLGLSRHGKWRSRHKPPRCQNCGEVIE